MPSQSFKIELKTNSVYQNSVLFWTILSLCKHKVRNALLMLAERNCLLFIYSVKRVNLIPSEREIRHKINCIECNEVH